MYARWCQGNKNQLTAEDISQVIAKAGWGDMMTSRDHTHTPAPVYIQGQLGAPSDQSCPPL